MRIRQRKGLLAVLVVLAAVFSLTLGVQAQGKANRYNLKTNEKKEVLSSSKATITTPYIKTVKNVNGGVRLTWSKSSGATGYRVYRAYREDSYFTTIRTIRGAGNLAYTDKDVVSGTEYCYSVIAFNDSGSSVVYSGHDTYGKYTYYLKRPVVTSLASSAKGVQVKWSKTPNAGGYILYRRPYGTTKYTKVKTLAASKYLCVDTTAVSGKKYTYTIKAFKKGQGYTSYSAVYTAGKHITYKTSSGSSTSTSNPVVYRALLIGESEYTDPDDNLKGPKNDVRVMRAMLKGMNYSAVTMKENQTSSQVLSAIRSAFANADSNDISLFYYTGHGFAHKGEGSGALFLNEDSYLLLSDLASALKAVKGKVVIMLDSCGSGAAISSSTGVVGASGSSTAAAADGEDFDPSAFNESAIAAFASAGAQSVLAAPKYREMVYSGKFYVITASRAHELSQDLGRYGIWGSAFTRGIVNGAGYQHGSSSYQGSMPADTNSNKAITMEEAYVYARKRTSSLVAQVDEEQHVIRYPYNSSLVIYKKK